jgi:hypothetical protein
MAGIKWIVLKIKAYSTYSERDILRILTKDKIASQNSTSSYVCNSQMAARTDEI